MTQNDPQFVPTRTSPAARTGARYGMSLVAVVLGAYLLIDGNWSSFAAVLREGDPVLGFFFVTQLLFGVVTLVFGILVAPAPPERRAIGAIIVVVLVLIYAVFQPLYVSGMIGGGLPIRGFSLSIILSPAFLVTLGASAAWLIIRERPGLSYLFLIATIFIPIILTALVFANLTSGLMSVATNVLVAVIGVGIAWGGRAVAGSRARPIG